MRVQRLTSNHMRKDFPMGNCLRVSSRQLKARYFNRGAMRKEVR
jgi:hypothetical protein